MKLHKEFKITITPKIHIIMDHLADFFRMNGGQSLKITTDQLIEASHQHVKNVFRNSQYNVQDPTSEYHGKKNIRNSQIKKRTKKQHKL